MFRFSGGAAGAGFRRRRRPVFVLSGLLALGGLAAPGAWAAPAPARLERPSFERGAERLRLTATGPSGAPIIEQDGTRQRLHFRALRWGGPAYRLTLAATWLRSLTVSEAPGGGTLVELETASPQPLVWAPAPGGRGGTLAPGAASATPLAPRREAPLVEPVLAPMPSFAPLPPAPAPSPADDGGPAWPLAPRAGKAPEEGGRWRDGKRWAAVAEPPTAVSRPDPWPRAPLPALAAPAPFGLSLAAGAGYVETGAGAGGFGAGGRLEAVWPELGGLEPRLGAQGLWSAAAAEALLDLAALRGWRRGPWAASVGLGYGARLGTASPFQHGPLLEARAASALAPGLNALAAWRLAPAWLAAGGALGWAQGGEVGLRFGSASASGGVGLSVWSASGYGGEPWGLRCLPELSAAWRF